MKNIILIFLLIIGINLSAFSQSLEIDNAEETNYFPPSGNINSINMGF
jgi:hypothetical protein